MEGEPDLHGLGSLVRERRHSLGLAQRQLGERIGWVQERVSLLERGGYGLPSLIILARLARALDTPLADLVASLGYKEILWAGTIRPAQEEIRCTALLYTLELFLNIRAVSLREVMDEASDVAARVMGAEMVEAYLYQSSSLVLVSLGSSRTSLARRQREIGLDRMPLNRVGRIVEVFASGRPYANGHVDRDPMVFRDLREELGIRSLIAQPIEVDGERVGVLVAESTEPERFSEDERHFFQAVSHWVGLMAQRERLLVQ